MRASIDLYTLFLSLVLATLMGCAASVSELDSDESGGDTNTDAAIGGNVTNFSIVDGVAQLDLSDVADDENVIVHVYALDDSSTASAFEISGSRSSSQIVQDPLLVSEEEGELTPPEIFEELLREAEADLDRSAFLETTEPDHAGRALRVTSRTFKVLSSFSSTTDYVTVTAQLMYDGDQFQFYVDERDTGSISTKNLQSLAAMFEGVVPIEKTILDGEESDVNGDGKFTVLFTRVVNELGSSSGGIVTGFFYAVDLFDDSHYAVSNEMEIFYTLVPDDEGDIGSAISEDFLMSNIYQGVLPHEYQHMINFNMHYNVNGGSTETSWLNEALSHLVEDLNHVDGSNYMVASGPENPARVASYLSQVESLCFTCGTSLSQRGGAYLWLRYLYEQAQLGNLPEVASGAELLASLVNTDLQGFENVIHAAFGDEGIENDLLTEQGYFGLATYLSNTGLSSDNRLVFLGINLRSVQDDNRNTELNGPSIQTVAALPFTDTITGTGLSYVQISGQIINDNGGALTLTVGEGASMGGYLIRE